MFGSPMNRRSTLRYWLTGIGLTFLPSRILAAIRTPTATAGPFYPDPDMRFRDADNDLVHVGSVARDAGGDVITLKGRVLDETGQAIENARIEIWQCDVNGRYIHTRDQGRKERDSAFQGFGFVVTGSGGTYAFRTIRPVPYTGRTPHIHVRVVAENKELITQFYIAGEPLNLKDLLFRRIPKQDRAAVEMVFTDTGSGKEATLDIVI
jgi:protocatechuate 3,4-dioxygenase beta subunit